MSKFTRWISRNTPLKIVLMVELIFVISYLFVTLILIITLSGQLSGFYANQLQSEAVFFQGVYEEQGLLGAIAAVERNVRAYQSENKAYSLVSDSGLQLAGNQSIAEFSAEWWRESDDLNPDNLISGYQGQIVKLGQSILWLGVKPFGVNKVMMSALQIYAVCSVLVFIFATLIARRIAKKMQIRLEAIVEVLDGISSGDVSRRINSSANDDIGHLSFQIDQALERLEVLVKGMRDVGADLAHDLKKPVSHLLISLEQMQIHSVKSHIQPGDFDNAIAQASAINRTFETLLQISQIEAGLVTAALESVNLNQLVSDVSETYLPVIEDIGGQLRSQLPDDDIIVRGIRSSLFQMLVQIIENSIRHGNADISIIVSRSGEYVSVSIADSGPGVPERYFDQLFERLFRMDKSRSSAGSGLGLSLVKAIVWQHNGRIKIYNNSPGLGVNIKIPLANKNYNGIKTA